MSAEIEDFRPEPGSFGAIIDAAHFFVIGKIDPRELGQRIAESVLIASSAAETDILRGRFQRMYQLAYRFKDVSPPKNELVLALYEGISDALGARALALIMQEEQRRIEEQDDLTREEIAFAAGELGVPTDQLPPEVEAELLRRNLVHNRKPFPPADS